MEKANSVKKLAELIRNSNGEFIENELRPFLRISSNTLNHEGIIEAKNYLVSYISQFSEEINEYKGEINPLIVARVEGKIKNSLLIYMMYDTQPISQEKEWISKPFGAEIKLLPPPLDKLGNCIIARGAYNSKTPLLCFLNIIKILKEYKSLPVSLVLLFDGDEEKGSPSLLKFLENEKYKRIFKNCIDAYYPATKQDLRQKSILKLGYKGILSLTIKISSENKEPHSAFSGMIPNPATDLVSLLNTIYSNNQFNINCLKHPYIPTSEEQSLLDEILKEINVNKIKKKAGIIQTAEEDPQKVFTNYLYNPTFNISTLKSGFLEEGTKNYVPNQAICNIDIRFAHNISNEDIFKEIKEKIEIFSKETNSHIEVIKNIGYDSSRVRIDSSLVKSLIKSAEVLDVLTEIWPLSAAAAPLSKIQKELGLHFITGGLGIGGFAHSANEFIQYDSIINTRLAYFYFLKIYSELRKKNL
ncbi:MAG: M20/M25/M40 family metallo-hydrolase [Candidatus Lokiarchaeota archaeon]|nr:M20/M25/M40 family metallo-hydrolase [Candidatus Lokiarchaeota archaeon]